MNKKNDPVKMELKGPFRKKDGQYEAQIQISNFKWPLTYDQV